MKKIDIKKAQAKFNRKLEKLRIKAANQHKNTIGALARRRLHGERPDTKALSELAAAIASSGKHDAEECVRRALHIWWEADFILSYAASYEEELKQYAPPPGKGPLPFSEFLKLFVEGARQGTREERFFDYELLGFRETLKSISAAWDERWKEMGKKRPATTGNKRSAEDLAKESIKRYHETGIKRQDVARMAKGFNDWWEEEKSRRLTERGRKGGAAASKAKKKSSPRK